nr:MAG TPA: hypothetical protein [Caudoviricetes sp.]
MITLVIFPPATKIAYNRVFSFSLSSKEVL